MTKGSATIATRVLKGLSTVLPKSQLPTFNAANPALTAKQTMRSFTNVRLSSSASNPKKGSKVIPETPTPQPTEQPKNQVQEITNPDLERLQNALVTGEFDTDILQKLLEASTKFVGASANSAAALVFMVPLLKLMIGARNNQPYSKTIQELKSTPFGELLKDGYLMLMGRIVASIIPALITQTAGFAGFVAVTFNTSAETLISGIPKSTTSEPYRIFRSLNGGTFDFIESGRNLLEIKEEEHKAALLQKVEKDNKEGKMPPEIIEESIFDTFLSGKNLARITKAEYDEAADAAIKAGIISKEEVPLYESFRMSFVRLKVLQENFVNNIPYQTAALLGRNGLFSSGIFSTKPLAGEFVTAISESLILIGLENEALVLDTASFALRALFASLTTPFHNTLIKLSSGEMSYQEFRQMPLSEQISFRGAIARTAFVVCAVLTIVCAQKTGEMIIDEVKSSSLLKTISDALEKHHNLKTEKDSKEDNTNYSKDNILQAAINYLQKENKDASENSSEFLRLLLDDMDFTKNSPQAIIDELLKAQNIINAVVKYIAENPGLFAGVEGHLLKQQIVTSTQEEPKITLPQEDPKTISIADTQNSLNPKDPETIPQKDPESPSTQEESKTIPQKDPESPSIQKNSTQEESIKPSTSPAPEIGQPQQDNSKQI